MENKIEMMRKWITDLNHWANAYYNGEEEVSNFEYDDLFNKLDVLEKETGIILPDSPTQKVGAEVVDYLPTFKHAYKALSLDKTKDTDEYVKKFRKGIEAAGGANKDLVLMYKFDGSTVQATYNDGTLEFLVTRGNGEVGSVITHNAFYLRGLPMTIPYKGEVVVRGEALMSYKEFDRINSTRDKESWYKNPRNLANASIQMLDSKEMSKREVCFRAFNLVHIEDENYISKSYDGAGMLKKSFNARLVCLSDWGFEVVPRWITDCNGLKSVMETATNMVADYEFPVDGLVACMDDYSYTRNLKGTGHNPNIMSGYAFKWQDATEETVLRDIEWSASRTGLLNPVAVFDPVELEGTTVTRASLHNLSYIADKDLRIGDRITVYKANMIIPQIADNLDYGQGRVVNINDYVTIEMCPVCGEKISIGENNDTFVVRCSNPFCGAKKIGAIAHASERDCLNIKGLSEEKIEFLVNKGYISSLYDLYIQARNYKEGYGILNEAGDDLEEEPGWGKQSVKNLADAVNTSRDTDFVSFIHAMGIPNVGKGQAKELKKYLDNNHDSLMEEYFPDNDGSNDLMGLLASMVYGGFDFTKIEGFGSVIASSLTKWVDDNLCDLSIPYMEDDDPCREIVDLLEQLHFTDKRPEKASSNDAIAGKTFVITGSLNHYKNRNELVSTIEKLGGKVVGSVSKNTDYLINNDTESTSGKNKKAKELGVRIISEIEFMEVI